MQLTSTIGLSGKPAGFQRWKLPVIWGLATGILLSLLSLLLYRVVMPANYRVFLFASFLINYLPLIQTLFYIGAGIHQRKAAGGNLTFREAFSAVFVVILIANAALLIWNFIYPLYIDPTLAQRIKEHDAAFMRSMKATPEQVAEKMQKWDSQLKPAITVGGILSSYVFMLATNAVFGLLAAAVARHRRSQ